jgi:hypothetical protein
MSGGENTEHASAKAQAGAAEQRMSRQVTTTMASVSLTIRCRAGG